MPPKVCTDAQVIARVHKSLEPEAKQYSVNLPSPTLPLNEYLSTLKKTRNLPIYAPTFGMFLSGETDTASCHKFENCRNSSLPTPCTVEQASAFLSVFPLNKLDYDASYYNKMGASKPGPKSRASAAKYKLRDSMSVHLLLPLARWPKGKNDRLKIGRMLLEKKGTDPNGTVAKIDCWCYTPNELGMGPIHIAAGTGDVEMVKLLLEFGADKGLKDGYGRTAVELAGKKGKRQVVKILEEWNGGGNLRGRRG
ncbi:hypothetical protein QBC38DRAFT_493417 [Podospora fimiseda]|uniref:Ankyrin repeat protein n=1 Tax=Podospora fimiseda TaxID=252190 RepID=A0AAN6YLL9_9PEZI|nr:hypothetical protein QBC38DRAFT_493417 [Podospora fimiseda]